MNEQGLAIVMLLRAVRRRMWLEAALRRLLAALRVAAMLLLAGAVVHAWWWNVTPAMVLMVAAGAPLGALLYSAGKGRPGMEEAARWADRQWGARELFVSALEVSVAPVVAVVDGAALVQRRAARRAAGLGPA